MAWIVDNVHTLWPVAKSGFQSDGRGSVVIDTTVRIEHNTGSGHLFGYLNQRTLTLFDDPDIQHLVRDYDPHNEFVTTLIKTQDRISSYRLRVLGDTREPLDRDVNS